MRFLVLILGFVSGSALASETHGTLRICGSRGLNIPAGTDFRDVGTNGDDYLPVLIEIDAALTLRGRCGTVPATAHIDRAGIVVGASKRLYRFSGSIQGGSDPRIGDLSAWAVGVFR